ncbi:MAG TPA: MarR family winged helix-turn-helix transcriptional regulator [Verrucomicrobiae bacterium]|jgi:DNA-binding MarR family transcriptional regulator
MSNELDMADVQNCVCFNLRSVTRAVTRFFDTEVRRIGLRPTQTPLLRALQAKNWGMAELSDFMGMERTTLVRNLRPLEREGLIKIKGGGRGGHVELMITERGRKKVAEAYPGWRASQDKVVAILGKERWGEMIRDLERVAEQLKKQ